VSRDATGVGGGCECECVEVTVPAPASSSCPVPTEGKYLHGGKVEKEARLAPGTTFKNKRTRFSAGVPVSRIHLHPQSMPSIHSPLSVVSPSPSSLLLSLLCRC
jgi:hypothetical protein